MNYIKVKVIDWGFKLLTLGVLAATLFTVVNAQNTANPAEIERLKLEAKERQEKAREEAKINNLPVPAIVDADLIRPT